MTIQFGRAITTPGDPLQKIPIDRLFLGISKPKQAFMDLIEQLQMVRAMDERQYRELKKQLPYFVCGVFHPPIRRTAHFARILYFVLDLDHLESADLDRLTVASRLREIPEVMLFFTSPSADGLKVMFRLQEPCSDSALFSAFYKIFAQRFAEKHGLQQVIDYKTSDVTRACFLSYDPAAYYNQHAKPVDLQVFVPNLSFDAAEKDLKAAEDFLKNQSTSAVKKNTDNLDEALLLKIKQKLNPHYRQPRAKNHFVPAQISDALPVLMEELAALGLQIVETQPINYGKKIKIVGEQLWAELNIFYGKKGFRVINTGKSGSSEQLAILASQAVEQILSTLPGQKP